MEQASAVATEVTSSIMRLKLEVEEKKRAVSLLQTALVRQPHAPACRETKGKSPGQMFLGAVASKCEIRALCPRSTAGLLGGVRRRWAAGSWAAAVPVPVSGRTICRALPPLVGASLWFLLAAPWVETLPQCPPSVRTWLGPFSESHGGAGVLTDSRAGPRSL